MNSALRYDSDGRHPIQVRRAGVLIGYATVCEARRMRREDAGLSFYDARMAAAFVG